ncbi:MAG: InlB B-repeat-containing protein [Clostridia bacterium]|nr:InlB B-repeat-containing protein [Clostridia bacterium]
MKKWLSVLLVLCSLISALPTFPAAAADAVPDASVFLKQSGEGGSCTLTSVTMLLRRKAYLDGNSYWSSIVKNAVRSTATLDGLSLRWDFTYAGMRVQNGSFGNMNRTQKKDKLISLLRAHPEGILIYMYGTGLVTHGILATDYDAASGTIYCSDPADGIAKGRIPLTRAYLTGNTQDDRIGNLCSYWYVSSGRCNLTAPAVVPNAHAHAYSYANDSAHPHAEYKHCSCGHKAYTGKNMLQTACAACYPVGGVNLTRSFEKTKGTAVFYRNAVSNATSYTLKLYRSGSLYNTYSMSSESYSVSGLPGGAYTATLYAKNDKTGEERYGSCPAFEMANTYAVSFDANGGTSAPAVQTKVEDISLTLTFSKPTCAHYIFKGWATSKNAIEARYQPGDTYTKNVKITLYAVWEPETYTIHFDANGGKGELEDVTITYGDTIRMPNTLVQDYCYLKGWSANKNATEPDYRLGVDYKLSANTTLYPVWGQSTWGGDVSSSLAGSGTETDPYKISTAADLAYLAHKVNNQTTAPTYEYYQLTDNITLAYSEWTPIGIGVGEKYFYGSFDGNGYTVSDLYITQPNEGYIGLFGYAKDSAIKNMTITGAIENISLTDDHLCIGGIVGYSSFSDSLLQNLSARYFNFSVNYTSIFNSDSPAFGYGCVGAVVGYAEGNIVDCTAIDCHVNCQNGRFNIGMIVGYTTGEVISCIANASEGGLFSGSFFGTIGGLCGYAKKIEQCSVKAPYFCKNLSLPSTSRIGGLAGEATSIKACNVSFNDSSQNSISVTGGWIVTVGGIAGSATSIHDCKFDGNSIVASSNGDNGTATSPIVAVGGLVGNVFFTNIVYEEGYLRNFININGEISGSGLMHVAVGGIIGETSRSPSAAEVVKAQNIIAVADSVTASTTGNGYKSYAGNIVGYNEANLSLNNTYYNSEMSVESSTNTIVTSGTARSQKTLNVSFYTNVLGLTPYTSLANVSADSSAVWVLKNGELPELYYNCLNDITVSEGIENGTISVDKAQAVDGEIVTVTATPAAGYVLNKIYVNGVEIAGTTFETNGKSDVFATFAEEIPAYSISVTADANATATLINADAVSLQSLGSTSLSASDGDEIRINTAANTDYTVDALYVNGKEIAGDSFILEADSVVTMTVTDIGTDISATTGNAEDVSDYFATLSGSVSDTDEGTARYIRYWRADAPDAVYTTAVEEGGGTYSATVFDLEAETTYCYQMTEHGEIKSFTTCAAPDSDSFADTPVGTPSVTVSVCRKTADGYTLSIESTEPLPEGIILIGLYTGKNELITMKQINCDGSSSYTATLPFRGAAMYAKVFVWNATGGMKPLGGAERIAVTIE